MIYLIPIQSLNIQAQWLIRKWNVHADSDSYVFSGHVEFWSPTTWRQSAARIDGYHPWKTTSRMFSGNLWSWNTNKEIFHASRMSANLCHINSIDSRGHRSQEERNGSSCHPHKWACFTQGHWEPPTSGLINSHFENYRVMLCLLDDLFISLLSLSCFN